MFDRKLAKENGKKNLKRHYVLFVIACLFASLLGSEYSDTNSLLNSKSNYSIIESNNNIVNDANISVDTVFEKILEGKIGESELISNRIKEQLNTKSYIGVIELGTSRGVFSGIVNNIVSGKFLITLFHTLYSIFNSESIALNILIIISALFMFSITLFLKDLYKVSYKRVFLEAHKYKVVKSYQFMFFIKNKKILKSCITIFVTSIFQTLWDITIIGGIIKSYSYAMVPYIVAENPNIKTLDAIKLSCNMMNGHKWECFKFDFSFFGWTLLGVCTLGLTDIFFANPYKEATSIYYYEYIRSLAKQNNVLNSDLLNDTYLFEYANSIDLVETYDDLVDIMTDEIVLKDYIHTGFRGFIENNFGIIVKYDKEEDLFNEAIEQEERIAQYRHILIHEQYPDRLSPCYLKDSKSNLDYTHYLRHYSIWSIVVLFFSFCFIGWSWEVMLHIVEDGVFVNRGTLHGPWLPIYGFGGIFILILLYRFRKNIALEAILSFTLCGFIEYFAHYYLELTKGTKWWDYSGYFLNINGRICAEGLLVFMFGGLAIVYIIGPYIDNLVRKANFKILKPICIALLIIFFCDFIYSSKYPNTGKGITDYDDVSYKVADRYLL